MNKSSLIILSIFFFGIPILFTMWHLFVYFEFKNFVLWYLYEADMSGRKAISVWYIMTILSVPPMIFACRNKNGK